MAKQVAASPVGKGAGKTLATSASRFNNIDFVKLAPLMGGISVLLVLASIVLILTKGFNYGIDFAGGTELQIRFAQPVEAATLRRTLEDIGLGSASVQSFGGTNEYLIRLENPRGTTEKEINTQMNTNVERVQEALRTKLGLSEGGVLRVDTVGPQVGSELKRNGLLAAFYSFLVILIYVALRFDYKYAPGAVLCLVHDCLLTLGLFALLGREMNVQIMAAILTLIGYSLNDTIVTFDRIRELEPEGRADFRRVINDGVNQTLGRTILTASTTLLAVISLYIFAGGVISDIAFTLLIGIIVGTYSSIYVAAPLVLLMDKWERARQTT